MKKSKLVLETVKWKSKSGVNDNDMIACVHAMTTDLKSLNGFLHQTLYKNTNNEWISIYYWETEKDAHNSNTSMENKKSFKNLIELVEPDTIAIEIMHQLQTSGKLSFDE